MKKIIAAFDGLRYSEATQEYTFYLAKLLQAHVVAVFLKERTRVGFSIYEAIETQSLTGRAIIDKLNKSDSATSKKAVDSFRSASKKVGITFTIHEDSRNPLQELIHESVFADLIVIDADETFSYMELGVPGNFLRHLLHSAQCPVIAVPKKFTPINEVTFLYDGSVSSVHAIRMFDYVFRDLKNLKTQLLFASSNHAVNRLPDNKLIREWMKRHYPNAAITTVSAGKKKLADSAEKFPASSLIVMGAYERSHFSMWFHESAANEMIRKLKLPIFITHTH
ncbi:MAG: hypothetical protein C5B59_05525 [Bacteroidetes bacterium]|nr:MAG: hypothetical protein C5B59_05525 [Bacteroidota bacterium]